MSLNKVIRTGFQIARAIDRANQRAHREKIKREREMERARVVSAREEEKYRREMLRESNRMQKAAQKTAIDDEKKAYEIRRKERELLRISFLKKIKQMEG